MLLPGREPEAGCGTQPCSHKEAGFSYLHLPFDLASDMKRHVSQVLGSKQNAASAPHLCLHVIRSLAHTCLAATDPYRPAVLLTVTSALPSHGCVTSRGNSASRSSLSRVLWLLCPQSGISLPFGAQPLWEMPSGVLLLARNRRYRSAFPP